MRAVGLLPYAREITAPTEQYWRLIKHAHLLGYRAADAYPDVPEASRRGLRSQPS